MGLYDPGEFPSEAPTPKVDAPVSPDFTFADVLAWARTKPADEEYSYWCDQCAIGQFLVETGRQTSPDMCNTWYVADDGERVDFDDTLDDAAWGGGSYAPRTFGAFVSRLEALSA
jgi:hypothetical protein